MSYSSNGNRPKLSEKGLLTPDNCVVALIDHQGQMLFGTSNFDRQTIINNTVAFGKAAMVFDGRNEVLQREHVAAAASRIPGAGTHRAVFHELVGRQTLCRRDRKKRSQKDSRCRPLDRSLCSVSDGTGDS
jgi:hypothetical protein